jgi:hypothetical protein
VKSEECPGLISDPGHFQAAKLILKMSELGQLETFPALPRMSVAGGEAGEISTITDIGTHAV